MFTDQELLAILFILGLLTAVAPSGYSSQAVCGVLLAICGILLLQNHYRR